MVPKIELKHQAADGYGFYWHLVDPLGKIRGWSGQGFPSEQACLSDAQAAVAAMRNPNLQIVRAY